VVLVGICLEALAGILVGALEEHYAGTYQANISLFKAGTSNTRERVHMAHHQFFKAMMS
jgi:hypothetical protein